MDRNMFELRGKTALITGAGRGVGAEIAKCLAERGASIGVNDVDLDRAQLVADWIRGKGALAIPAQADVTSPSEIRSAVAQVTESLGPIDILVHNAGIPVSGFQRERFIDTAPESWDRYISINLYGLMYTTHAVLSSMVERGWGRILAVVSDAGRFGEPNAAAYSAGKAGAAGFIRSLAREVGRQGVNCNAVSLGSIEPPDGHSDPRVQKQAAQYPVGRLGRPADVVAAALWLVSEEASWVTGQTVSVNGGYMTV